MKYILTAALLICFAATHAQDVVTTLEEYNYLTKGYKVQIESGLDMKKGYTFTEGHSPIVYGNYTFTFKPLVRESTNETAAILLIINSKAWGNNTYYFCIPRNNQELSSRHIAELKLLDATLIRAYAELASLTLGEMMAQLNK